jgi:hypothetical protein
LTCDLLNRRARPLNELRRVFSTDGIEAATRNIGLARRRSESFRFDQGLRMK